MSRRDEITHNQRNVVRCTAKTKTGAQCKRRTARTSLCYAHLERDEHLRVKPSTLGPHTGLGLFTTIRRPEKRMVAPYTGTLVERPANRYGGAYVIQLNNSPPFKYVDANKTTDGAGRFANSAREGDHRTNNSRLRPDPRNHMAKVVSTKAIPAGKEILAQYGRSYWGRH